jgi:hypothetical protein
MVRKAASTYYTSSGKILQFSCPETLPARPSKICSVPTYNGMHEVVGIDTLSTI